MQKQVGAATATSGTSGNGIAPMNKPSQATSSIGKTGVKVMPDLTHLTPVSVVSWPLHHNIYQHLLFPFQGREIVGSPESSRESR